MTLVLEYKWKCPKCGDIRPPKVIISTNDSGMGINLRCRGCDYLYYSEEGLTALATKVEGLTSGNEIKERLMSIEKGMEKLSKTSKKADESLERVREKRKVLEKLIKKP